MEAPFSSAASSSPVAEAEQPAIEATSHTYLGQWNRLVSTTNWEKGRIICQWREALIAAGAPPTSYTDEAWSRRVGNVTPQHTGRLRRVFDRFAASREAYSGLFWSHFQVALDWNDAEMWLEGAVQNGWSVAQVQEERWRTLGGNLTEKPADEPAAAEVDEDTRSAGNAVARRAGRDAHGLRGRGPRGGAWKRRRRGRRPIGRRADGRKLRRANRGRTAATVRGSAAVAGRYQRCLGGLQVGHSASQDFRLAGGFLRQYSPGAPLAGGLGHSARRVKFHFAVFSSAWSSSARLRLTARNRWACGGLVVLPQAMATQGQEVQRVFIAGVELQRPFGGGRRLRILCQVVEGEGHAAVRVGELVVGRDGPPQHGQGRLVLALAVVDAPR